jgi:hypothetical protein
MEYYLYLRPVCEQDIEIIHSWQLNPLIIKQFNLPNSNPNSWSDTLAWWKGLGNSLVFVLMIVDKVQSATYWRGRPIGLSWVKNVKSELPEIGGYIGDTDYCRKLQIEMYNVTLETINRLKGIQTACLKIKREEQQLIGVLSQCGWHIDNETEGVVQLNYGTTSIQNPQ